MKIRIEIPKEFEEDFNMDRFEDALCRLAGDAHFLAGNYEVETAEMLIEALKHSQLCCDETGIYGHVKGLSESKNMTVKTSIGEITAAPEVLEHISAAFNTQSANFRRLGNKFDLPAIARRTFIKAENVYYNAWRQIRKELDK